MSSAMADMFLSIPRPITALFSRLSAFKTNPKCVIGEHSDLFISREKPAARCGLRD